MSGYSMMQHKNNIAFFVGFLFFSTFPGFGQEIIVSGFVADNVSGEPLIGVNIYDASKKGTVSNEYGYFYLKTSDGDSARITFSYIGYRQKTLRVRETAFLHVELEQGVDLSDVTITGNDNRTKPGIQTVTPDMIKAIPSLLGEPDVLKTLMYFPGVISGDEGSSNLHVRGGNSDQNLFLLDDIRLYHVNHLGGFMSAFDANIIKQVDLYKGNFPARFGGRLSSVVDVHLKDGNGDRKEGELMLGTLASKVYFEGPIGDKTTFLASLRRFNLDIFSRIASNSGYTFYDFNGKITHRFNEKNKLYAIFYAGRDKVFDNRGNSKLAVKWGNYAGAVKWTGVLKQDLFLNTSIAYTVYFNDADYKINMDTHKSKSAIKSNINDLSGKFNFSYFREKSNYTLGGEAIFHRFVPHLMSYKGDGADTIFFRKQHIVENNLYSDIHLNPVKPLLIDLGIRWSTWSASSDYRFIQPRGNVSLCLRSDVTFNASFSRMVQFVHLLTVSGAGIPSDLWLASTKKTAPETALQWAFGVAYSPGKSKINLKTEFFYKKMQHLIQLKEGMVVQPDADIESLISTGGKGEAKGLEFLLEKKSGKLTGWLSYTLSKNERIFEDMNNGKPFPDVYDRTHDISIVLSYSLTDRSKISATWVYASGRLTTLPVQKYDIIDFTYFNGSLLDWTLNEAHVYGEKNGFRFPPYHRLDFGFTHTKQKKCGKRIWSVGLYNVYNRQNPYYYYIDPKTNKLYQVSLFPIIPSIAYSFVF